MRNLKNFTIKKLFLLCIISIAIFTSGCAKYSYDISIDKKGNVVVSEIDAINQLFMEYLDGETIKTLENSATIKKYNLIHEKFNVNDFSDGKYQGIDINKKYKLSKFLTYDLPLGFSTPQDRPIVVTKSFFKKTYSIILNYNIGAASRNILDEYGIRSTLLTNSVYIDKSSIPKDQLKPEAELTIEIPVNAKYHNADKVDGHKYTWNLVSGKASDISIKYEMMDWLNIWLIIAIIVLSILLYITVKYKDKSTNNWL